jgi:hypothetical protein
MLQIRVEVGFYTLPEGRIGDRRGEIGRIESLVENFVKFGRK